MLAFRRDTFIFMNEMKERKVQTLQFSLEGEIPSKKNAWKPTAQGGRYIPGDVQSEIDALLWQLKPVRSKLPHPISGPISIQVEFTTQTKRRDTDNRYTTLQDILQKAGIIENDNNVDYFSCRRNVSSKSKPQVDIEISYAS